MSQQLTNFMEKLTREVQEGVPVARRVRLQAEGTVFETWEPIQGGSIEPGQWATDAEALIAQLITELPKRRVQLSFIAEDSAGATITTLPRTVTGQNQAAQDLGTQNGAKALADALASVAKTADNVLESARKMMTYQLEVIEKQAGQLSDAHELFMKIREVELEGDQQENATAQIMVEQLKNAGPLLMKLVEHVLTKPPQMGASGAAAAAAAAAAKPPS